MSMYKNGATKDINRWDLIREWLKHPRVQGQLHQNRNRLMSQGIKINIRE